jgi:hypothetical protein
MDGYAKAVERNLIGELMKTQAFKNLDKVQSLLLTEEEVQILCRVKQQLAIRKGVRKESEETKEILASIRYIHFSLIEFTLSDITT